MKAFLPPLDSVWRFTYNWTPPERFLKLYDNRETLFGYKSLIEAWEKATGDKTAPGEERVKRFHAWEDAHVKADPPQFLVGTVIRFERYHVSRSGEDCITIMMVAAPDERINPKKNGGKMKGKGRLYLTLAGLNTLPVMEEVHALS